MHTAIRGTVPFVSPVRPATTGPVIAVRTVHCLRGYSVHSLSPIPSRCANP